MLARLGLTNTGAGFAFCHADLRYRRQRMDRRKILGRGANARWNMLD